MIGKGLVVVVGRTMCRTLADPAVAMEGLVCRMIVRRIGIGGSMGR